MEGWQKWITPGQRWPKHIAILFDCLCGLGLSLQNHSPETDERIKASKQFAPQIFPNNLPVAAVYPAQHSLPVGEVPTEDRGVIPRRILAKGRLCRDWSKASTRSRGLPWASYTFKKSCHKLPGLEFRQHTAEATSSSGTEKFSRIHPWVYTMLLPLAVQA